MVEVLVADAFPERHIAALQALGCQVRYEPDLKADALPAALGTAKILMVRSKQVSAATLTASDRLALVLRAGAGVNTIDVKAASARGIFVSNCPGKNSIAVAELVFALMLGIDRRIAENVQALRAHQWNKKEFSKADGLFGKTLGVIGVGAIGRQVIQRAHAFGMRVLAWSRSLDGPSAESLGVEHCQQIDDVFRRADIVSLHVAFHPETRHLVNAERLRMMKPRAILINTSRGEVVDQRALQDSLQTGRLRAGLDVFDPEPAGGSGSFDDPILGLPGLYGTHHIGASTEQAQETIAEEAVRIVRQYVRTGEVLNCVNLTRRTPARCQLMVRHFDQVGVLAFVLDQIRRAGTNVEEIENVIFEGATAANCRIQLGSVPDEPLLRTIREGNPHIISLEAILLSGGEST